MSSADKLLEKMRLSKNKSGFMPDDFKTLYLGFGFEAKEGGNHTTYKHKKYSFLITQVPRHKPAKPYYVKCAIDLIDKLSQLELGETNGKLGI
jgi:hypothetical protein